MPLEPTVPSGRCRALQAILLCVAAWCCSAGAQDKWDECDDIGAQSGPYKLLITDMLQDKSKKRVELLKDFRAMLSERVHQLFKTTDSAPNIVVILCPLSQPQTEIEFGTVRIRSLHKQDVVMVLWGRRSERSLTLSYVVVPYRRAALEKGDDRGAGLVGGRPVSISNAANFKQLLDLLSQNSLEAASAYFALGVGVHKLGAERPAEALRFLCFAKESFRDQTRVGSVPKDIEGFLDQKLREVAKVIEGRGGAEFARQHPIEKCGAG